MAIQLLLLSIDDGFMKFSASIGPKFILNISNTGNLLLSFQWLTMVHQNRGYCVRLRDNPDTGMGTSDETT